MNRKVLTDVLKMPKICKGTYWIFINSLVTKRNIKQKWPSVLNENITADSIHKSFEQNFESCLDSKLKSFQFKILHRSLTTNIFLNKCNIKQDDKCTFCQNEPESIEYLFWDCNFVQKFWKNVSEQFKSYFNFNNALNKKNDLLRVTHGIHKEQINLIFNLCKRYVLYLKYIGILIL